MAWMILFSRGLSRKWVSAIVIIFNRRNGNRLSDKDVHQIAHDNSPFLEAHVSLY